MPYETTKVRLAEERRPSERPRPTYGTDSPIILTNTRFRRRPSRLPGQPVHLALKDPLPRAKIQAVVGHRHHRCASRPMTCEVESVCAAAVQPISAARFTLALAPSARGCASAKLAHSKPLSLVPDRRPLRCDCATGLRAGLVNGRVGRWVQPAAHLFKPHLVIVMQATLVVVD
jgi:hypothetical protein